MLVIYKNNTYQVIAMENKKFLLKLPYVVDHNQFWVSQDDVEDYPRTWPDIINSWLPNCIYVPGEIERYLLEITTSLLSPKFIIVPKDPGYYSAIWMNVDNSLKMSIIVYSPDHGFLDTFLVDNQEWVSMGYFTGDSFRYLRFSPFNLGVTYMYTKYLIDSGNFTREEVEEMWKRNRNGTS